MLKMIIWILNSSKCSRNFWASSRLSYYLPLPSNTFSNFQGVAFFKAYDVDKRGMNMGQKQVLQCKALNKHWEHANKSSDLFCAPFSCIVG